MIRAPAASHLVPSRAAYLQKWRARAYILTEPAECTIRTGEVAERKRHIRMFRPLLLGDGKRKRE